jgi:hypothetical protein
MIVTKQDRGIKGTCFPWEFVALRAENPKKPPARRFFTLQTPSNQRFAACRIIGISALPMAQKSTSATAYATAE